MIRIVESKFISSAVYQDAYPETVWLDFAFVGRSNVGKSSMINTLTNRKLLAKIANKPGKTRLINFFDCKYQKVVEEETSAGFFTLVDLPGYGYAKVSKSERDLWKRMINGYFQSRKQLAGVVLLVDIRHEPDPKDAVMVKMLQDMKVNFMVACTKCDKIPAGKIPAAMKQIKNAFRLNDTFLCEFSSVKRTGQEKILNWIETIIETDVLNNRIIVHD